MALIKIYNSTPTNYTHGSRDFQLIGHVYESVFNSSKLAIDMLDKMMPNDDFDERLLNLSTSTVGFIRKHEYNKQDLTMVLSSFAYLIRRKGTRQAIEYAINIMLRSQGISDPYLLTIDSKNKYLELGLSIRLDDLVLLKDLFAYLLPFGFEYRIVQYTGAGVEGFKENIKQEDKAEFQKIKNKGIVNETFKTTIEKVPTEVIKPRPVKDGEIQEML